MAAEFSPEQLKLYGDTGAPQVQPLAPSEPIQAKPIAPKTEELRAYALKKAQEKGIDPAVFLGLIDQESGWNTKARSRVGARGLTQLMPGTAKELGVDPDDPFQNIDGGAEYLSQQVKRYGGDYQKALAAYNAGPGAVDKHGGIPPWSETQEYVPRVLANAEKHRKASGETTTKVKTPPHWKDIAGDPEVQKLSDDDFDKLRQTYFEDVIAPELGAQQVPEVHAAFMSETKRPGAVAKMWQNTKDLLTGAAEPSGSGQGLRAPPADMIVTDMGVIPVGGEKPPVQQEAKPQEPMRDMVGADLGITPDIKGTPPQPPADDGQRLLDSNQADVILQGLDQRSIEAAQRGEANFPVEIAEREALHAYLSKLPQSELKALAARPDAGGATVRKIIAGGMDFDTGRDWGPGIKVDDSTWEIVKGLKAGGIGIKQLGSAAAITWLVQASKSIEAQMQAFDKIEKGEQVNPRETPFPGMVGQYEYGSPEQRQALRDQLFRWVDSNNESKAGLVDLWKQYQAEMKKINPNAPNFTDLLDPEKSASFIDWFNYNTGQAIPYSAAALIAGVLGGAPGLMAFGTVTGQGDMATNAMEAGASPEQAADQATGIKPLLYGGAEIFLGPIGRFVAAPVARKLRGMSKEAIEATARGYFKALGREAPKDMVGEFANEWFQEMLNTGAKTGVTGQEYFTDENLKDWFNAGMAGAAGAPATSATIRAGEHLTAKAKAELDKRAKRLTGEQPTDAAEPPKQATEKPERIEPELKSEPGDLGGPTEPTMEGEAPSDLGGRPDPVDKPVPYQARGIADEESHIAADEPSITEDGPTIGEALAKDEGPTSNEPKLRVGEDISGAEVEAQAAPTEGERSMPAQEGPQPRAQDTATPEPLTPEAQEVIASADADGVPAFVTNRLKQVANQNGVDPTGKTPNEIIDELRAKANPEPPSTASPQQTDTAEEGAEPARAEQAQTPPRSKLLKPDRAERDATKAAAKQTEEPVRTEQQTADPAATRQQDAAEQQQESVSQQEAQEQPRQLTPDAQRLVDNPQSAKMTSKPQLDEIAKRNGVDPEGKTRQQIIEDLREVANTDQPAEREAAKQEQSPAQQEDSKTQQEKERALAERHISEYFGNATQQAAAKTMLGHAPPEALKYPRALLEQIQAAGFGDAPGIEGGVGSVSNLEFDPLVPERAALANDLGKAVAESPDILPMPEGLGAPIPPMRGSKMKMAAPKDIEAHARAVREGVYRAVFSHPVVRAGFDQAARDYKGGHRRLRAIIDEMRDLLQASREFDSRLPAMGVASRLKKAGHDVEVVSHATRHGRWVIRPARQVVVLNPEVRAEMQRMAANAGWAERGGLLLRDKGAEGNVIGRTQWVPKEEWWAQRWVLLNEKQTQEAVRKALAGEPLGKRERTLIDYMTKVAQDTVGQIEEAARRIDEGGGSAQDLTADDPFALAADLGAQGLDATAENLIDHDLVTKAMQANPAAVEALPDSLEPDAFMQRIREILDESQSATESRGESDAPASQEGAPRRPAADSGVLAQAGQAKKRRLKPPKSLNKISVLVPARTADGEESVIEMQADEALARLDADLQKLKELLDCLSL